jgi:hypothetical protein
MQLMTRTALLAVVTTVLAGALAAPAPAHAAEGWLSMRTGYYKERSTRVVQPMVDGHLDVTDSDALDVHVLVDSITSASSATGAPVVEGATFPQFSEKRYEGGAGYSHDFAPYKLGGAIGRSTESDYDSNFFDLRGEVSLDDKNTVLALNLARNFDSITNGAAPAQPRFEDSMNGGSSSLSLTQLLSPDLYATFVYDFMDVHGYQANPYRKVSGSEAPVPERAPRYRYRHAASAGLRGYLPASATTYVLGYRFYADDWGILAHNVEARLVQELTPGLEVRARYRFYTQSAAFFYKDTYSKAQIDGDKYVTDDAKLDAYHTQVFGLQVLGALSLIGATGDWAELRVDAIIERVLQTNAFADAWSAQLGLVVPLAW